MRSFAALILVHAATCGQTSLEPRQLTVRADAVRVVFPPSLIKVNGTLEFLGYTRVRPVKRQWEYLRDLAGELRYATPGSRSSNMEEVMFYLQYLKALPTLRLTVAGRGSEEFETTHWQAAAKAEPLCHASGYQGSHTPCAGNVG